MTLLVPILSKFNSNLIEIPIPNNLDCEEGPDCELNLPLL